MLNGLSQYGQRGDLAVKTLIPVTLRKLSEAQPDAAGDGWRLDARPLSSVRVVAALRGLTDGDARVGLDLSDGTASASVAYFPDPEDIVWANTRGSLR